MSSARFSAGPFRQIKSVAKSAASSTFYPSTESALVCFLKRTFVLRSWMARAKGYWKTILLFWGKSGKMTKNMAALLTFWVKDHTGITGGGPGGVWERFGKRPYFSSFLCTLPYSYCRVFSCQFSYTSSTFYPFNEYVLGTIFKNFEKMCISMQNNHKLKVAISLSIPLTPPPLS